VTRHRKEDDAINVLDAIGSEDATLISVRLVLTALMKELGGPAGFAKMLADDFMAAAPGSRERVSLGGKIMQSLQNFGADDSMEQASEEELLAELRDIMKDDLTMAQAMDAEAEDDEEV
jgi:hypothetical protein